jgi:hypothetical protein
LIDENIILDNGGLTDHNTRPMVDKNTPSYGSARMDVYVGNDLINSHNKAGEGFEIISVEFVGNTVPKNRPYARIIE